MASFGDDSPSSEKRKWCDHGSVLDLNITDSSWPPLKLPVAQYLKEVMLGLHGGEADSRIQADLRSGVECPLARNVEELANLVNSENSVVVPVCSALFWLTLGIVFQRVPDTIILADFRNQLAQSWYLLCLESQTQILHREARDWALAALPFLIAQAIYRMLCDAFEDDRKHFVSQAEKLLDKISLVMHFEVTGFQLTSETVRKARKKLFLRNVLHNPQLDLFQSEEAKKRQEMLESQNANNQDRPLSFGQKDGQALEDTQLEHVMQERAKRIKGKISSGKSRRPSSLVTSQEQIRRASGGELIHRRVWEPQEDLSVERYETLSRNGEAMWGRHLAELSQILGQDAEEEQTIPSPPHEQAEETLEELDFDHADSQSSLPSPKSVDGNSPKPKIRPMEPGTPLLRSISVPSAGFSLFPTSTAPLRLPLEHQPPRMIKIAGNHVSWPAKTPLVKRNNPVPNVWKTSSQSQVSSSCSPTEKKSDIADEPDCLLINLPNNRRTAKKKKQSVGKLATVWMNNTKERKELDAKKKRMSQEALQMIANPLPPEFLTVDQSQKSCYNRKKDQNENDNEPNELVTTWVSPVMKRLAAEDDRWSVLRKSRAESRQCKMHVFPVDDGASPGNSARATGSSRVGTAQGKSRAVPAEVSSPLDEGRPRTDGRQRGIIEEKGSPLLRPGVNVGCTPTSSELRAVGGSKTLILPSKSLPPVMSTSNAPLTLEPPSSLSTSVVVNRIEAQGSAFRQTTFAEYLKKNDIFSGEPKVRFDDKRLRTEEESALRKTQVDGPAKKLLYRRR